MRQAAARPAAPRPRRHRRRRLSAGERRDPRRGKQPFGLRDAEALLETYGRLQVRFADEVDWRRLVGVRRALVARRRGLAGDGALPQQIAAFGEALRAVRDRLPSWPLADSRFDDLAPGFKRSYRRGRKAMRAVDEAPSDGGFHEWRKRAKDHRYHLELLRDLWPAQIKARRAEVRALGELLGDDHDLTVLRATLDAERERFGDGAGPAARAGRAAARRSCARRCGRPARACSPSGRRRWCGATASTGRPGGARAIEARWTRPPEQTSAPRRCGVMAGSAASSTRNLASMALVMSWNARATITNDPGPAWTWSRK